MLKNEPENTTPTAQNSYQTLTETTAEPLLTPVEEDVETLIATIRKESEVRKKSRKMALFIQRTLGFALVLTVVMFLLRGLATGKWEFETLVPLILLVTGVSAISLSQQQKEATVKLATTNDMRAVGPLLEALEVEDEVVQTAAIQALVKLLPRLKASDASLLNEEQRNCLNRALQNPDTVLKITVLEALQQVGGENAIPLVEKLTTQIATTEAERDVRNAAVLCLPFLRERVENEKVSRSLLRASDAIIQLDTLLRPVSSTGETAPEQLLRPVEE